MASAGADENRPRHRRRRIHLHSAARHPRCQAGEVTCDDGDVERREVAALGDHGGGTAHRSVHRRGGGVNNCHVRKANITARREVGGERARTDTHAVPNHLTFRVHKRRPLGCHTIPRALQGNGTQRHRRLAVGNSGHLLRGLFSVHDEYVALDGWRGVDEEAAGR